MSSETGITIDTPKLNRRSFLGLGVVAGAVSVGSILGIEPKEASAKTYDTIDDMYEIDNDNFDYYDGYRVAFQHRNAYMIPDWPVSPQESDDPLWAKAIQGDVVRAKEMGDPGWQPLDKAYYKGGAASEDLGNTSQVRGAGSYRNTLHMPAPDGRLVPMTQFGQETASFIGAKKGSFDVAEERYEFDSLEHASYAVKKAAKKFGASLVGIAPYDERWVFKTEVVMPKDSEGKLMADQVNYESPIGWTFEPKSVVVMGHEMDYEAMKTSGGQAEVGATMMGYSNMMVISLRLATFLRHLGYNTYHCGNNVSASVAEAIRAGLGEGGRNSLCISKEFGPRFRISKVYTDCEFDYDKPQGFGVTEFCEVCQVCTDTCPSGAIRNNSIHDPESMEAIGICGQKGVRKYQLDALKCHYQWMVMGQPGYNNDCGICITVCPYNKPQTWNHELVKVVTLIPGLNSLARYFDHFFGFGHLATDQELVDFWRMPI